MIRRSFRAPVIVAARRHRQQNALWPQGGLFYPICNFYTVLVQSWAGTAPTQRLSKRWFRGKVYGEQNDCLRVKGYDVVYEDLAQQGNQPVGNDSPRPQQRTRNAPVTLTQGASELFSERGGLRRSKRGSNGLPRNQECGNNLTLKLARE